MKIKKKRIWRYFNCEGYQLRICPKTLRLQAKGPGGWTDVP